MRKLMLMCWLSTVCFAFASTAQSQQGSERFELCGLVGGANVSDTKISAPGAQEFTTVTSPATFAWQANFGWKALHWGPAAVFLEVPVSSAISRQSDITVAVPGGSVKSFGPSHANYFIVPGLRFRFLNKKLSPFVATGFGVESIHLDEAQVSATGGGVTLLALGSRTYKGVFDFGGGLDMRLQRYLSLRVEFRDFIRAGRSSGQSGTTTVLQDVLPSRHTLVPLAGLVVGF